MLNVLRGRGTTASCVPPRAYAQRQTDFVLSKMLGLFNTKRAQAYASAYGLSDRQYYPALDFIRTAGSITLHCLQ